MKHLRETFTDEEFESLLKIKNAKNMNWHDFILSAKDYTVVALDGIVKVNAYCPTCKSMVLVNVRDLLAP